MKRLLVLILLLAGCAKQPETPKPVPSQTVVQWKGDRAYIGGQECGWVFRKNGQAASYQFDIGPKYRYTHISGGSEGDDNDYSSKMNVLKVEEYCATEFGYYGEGATPYDGTTSEYLHNISLGDGSTVTLPVSPKPKPVRKKTAPQPPGYEFVPSNPYAYLSDQGPTKDTCRTEGRGERPCTAKDYLPLGVDYEAFGDHAEPIKPQEPKQDNLTPFASSETWKPDCKCALVWNGDTFTLSCSHPSSTGQEGLK